MQGFSAGAIISANVNFVAPEGNSGNAGFSSRAAAAVPISGAVWPFFFNSVDQSFEPPTPYFAVHGDVDTRVYPFLATLSYRWFNYAGLEGAANRLVMVQGGGHVPWQGSCHTKACQEMNTRDRLRPVIMSWLAQQMGCG